MSLTADNLAEQRALAGHSVTSLAKVAGVSDWTIQRLEVGGHEENAVVQAIADALGISLATLGAREL